MLEFLNNNSGAIITGVCGIIGIIISSITSSRIAKKKYQSEGGRSLEQENKKLKEELELLKGIAETDNTLDKSHGSIYYETMPDGKRKSLCGFCWEESHKKIPLRTYHLHKSPNELYGCCEVCKRTCHEELEPQMDRFSSCDNGEKITII